MCKQHGRVGTSRRPGHYVGCLRCRAIVHCQPGWDVPAKTGTQLVEIRRPCNCHGNIPHGILYDQVPPDNPCHDFAKGGIGIRVCASGDRHERSKLRVTQAAERTRNSSKDERDDDGRPGTRSHEVAGHGCPDRRENSSADDRTYPEHQHIKSAECALQLMLRFGCIRKNAVQALRPEQLL